jgi:hypothetical protein
MKTLAHFVCTVFGLGALLVGILGLVRAQWESGVASLCMGAALFLLALIDDRTQEVGEIREKLDRLLEQTRGSAPKS